MGLGDIVSISRPCRLIPRRLLGAVHSGLADETLAYDGNGNRAGTGVTVPIGDRLMETADYTYQYDDAGQRTRRTSRACYALLRRKC